MTRRRRVASAKRRLGRARFHWCAVAVATTACFPPDEGLDPNLNQIYFPTGLALSPVKGARACGAPVTATHRWLYVVNSDFDLQYNAGTVQVFDLDRIDEVIAKMAPGAADPESRCPANVKLFGTTFPGGKKTEAEQFVSPGLCNPVDTTPLIKASVKIGAFATDIRYLERPGDPKARANATSDMLVVPVRGDDTLHWIDTNPDPEDKAAGALIDCGADERGACDAFHRRGDNPQEDNTRSAELPREPFGIAADDRGEAIVTTHQSDGALGLFVNDWSKVAPGEKGPSLQFTLGGLPIGAVGIASIPEPDVARALSGTEASTFYQPGYYVTFRNAAQLQLVRYFSDQGEFKNPDIHQTYPGRAFLEQAGEKPIVVNSQGFDSRGIAIQGSRRHDCECRCDPGPADCRTQCVEAVEKADPGLCADPDGQCGAYVKCLRSCAATPLDVFVANRTPPSLILGRTVSDSSPTSSDDLPSLYETEQLTAGPSRVVAGSVRVRDGLGGTRVSARVFVISFDSRNIFVYDPARPPGFESVIRTGRGPHALIVDEARGLGYVAHFTDSYIGVVDLNQAHPNTYGKMILTIGAPTPPRAQK